MVIMNLQMVLINLDRMIAGKEQELAEAIYMKQSLSKELDAYKELYALGDYQRDVETQYTRTETTTR
jgi:hypothetical protein